MPEEYIKSAHEIAVRMVNDYILARPVGNYRDDLEKMVEKAIIEERERCVKRAEEAARIIRAINV